MLSIIAFLFPRQLLTVDSGEVKADAIVVLGGDADGRPRRAAQLFEDGAAPFIIVTGFGDSRALAKVLLENGVPLQAITLEEHARTTLQNAEFSVPLLRKRGASRVIIVTSWYHSRRALACFEHAAPEIKFYSVPDYHGFGQNYQPVHDGYVGIAKEYGKLFGYWLIHGVRPF